MDTSTESTNRSPSTLESFLTKEYDNIAQAHFKTIETISEFFKHYLTLATIPITVIAVVLNIESFKQSLANSNLPIFISVGLTLISILFLVISMVGLMVLWHVMNLRWDALLYARTVNGIRKYFYDGERNIDLTTKNRIRVLPQSPLLPEYGELSYSFPLVFIFALLNSLYLLFCIFTFQIAFRLNSPTLLISPTIIFFCTHFVVYKFLADKREFSYLRSNVIGVDIDGVLNKHRDHFCKVLREVRNINVTPEMITKIPVRECDGLNVSAGDEIAVFNTVSYWTEMPVNDNASDVLRKLKNSYKLKVFFFTSRPWPLLNKELPKKQQSNLIREWNEKSKNYRKQVWIQTSRLRRFIEWTFDFEREMRNYKNRRVDSYFRKATPMEKITKDWLKDHNFDYDRLTVERGSEDVLDPAAHIHNRFYVSRIMRIKYFVEDDPIKASKLAYICDVVFLVDHPYNRSAILPTNVLRVDSWNDILKYMRELW